MMKDYLTYTMMNQFGAAAPLCSFAYITVNGEDWGLYLAVEGIEDSFLERNYDSDYGELYKPDSMSFGGGRGNGKDFSMDDFMTRSESSDSSDASGGMTMPNMGGFDPSAMFGGEMPDMGNFDPSSLFGGGMPDMGSFDPSQMQGGFGGMFPGQSSDTTQTTPSQTPDSTDSAATTNRPSRDNMQIPGGNWGSGGGSMGSAPSALTNWVWLGVSVLILAAGLIIAKLYKRW